MRKLSIVLVFVFVPLFITNVYAGDSSKAKNKPVVKKETPSPWGLSFIYSENGFGPAVSYHKNLNSTTQLITGLSLMSVSDSREFEQYDYFGNRITPNKENRIFMLPLNIGIKKEMFSDDITGSIKPIVQAGISPSLILTNPYSREYFNAFGYMQAAFAIGGYAGAGLEFSETQSVAFSLYVNYSYVTPIGKEVNSLYNKPISNLTGFQMGFGVKF
ncbi:MAG: hypothetical protein JSS63_13690 [Bacteroidetes bacterium]|nr:hypothetical protein [Bacteroidota bacterium]